MITIFTFTMIMTTKQVIILNCDLKFKYVIHIYVCVNVLFKAYPVRQIDCKTEPPALTPKNSLNLR